MEPRLIRTGPHSVTYLSGRRSMTLACDPGERADGAPGTIIHLSMARSWQAPEREPVRPGEMRMIRADILAAQSDRTGWIDVD